MVTLNPFEIHENFSRASDLEKYLPIMMEKLGSEYDAERTKANGACRKLGNAITECYCDNGLFFKLRDAYKKLIIPKDIELTYDGEPINIKEDINPSTAIAKIKDKKIEIDNELAGQVTGGIAGGAFFALGAYFSVGALGVASTGTPIATLAGAAKLNAILAWFGGGSIVSGGAGVAGGMIALSGAFAVPAILITWGSIGAKSETARAKAESALEEYRVLQSKVQAEMEELNQSGKIAQLQRKILERFLRLGEISLHDISKLAGVEIKNSSKEDKQKCLKANRLLIFLNGFSEKLIEEGLKSKDKEKICKNYNETLDKLEACNG